MAAYTLVVAAAVDGEPLVGTGRAAAALHAEELLAGLTRLAATHGARAIVAVERRAEDARAALRACAPGVSILDVPDVAGCRDAGYLAALAGVAPGEMLVVPAERLLAGAPLCSVAGAVGAPGVRRVAAGTTVEQLVELAGGATCGPAWLAVDGTLAPRALDREASVDGTLRAVIVLPGAAELARRARGDRRALDPTDPLGIERGWLGEAIAAAAGGGADGLAGRAPLSLALVAARLGLPADGLSLYTGS